MDYSKGNSFADLITAVEWKRREREQKPFRENYVTVNSRWKPPLYAYPRLGALLGGVLSLIVFGLLQPWITGTPRSWPWVLG